MIWQYHRCVQGLCPSAIYFCLFHHSARVSHLIHVKQLFDGEGMGRGKYVRREDECWYSGTLGERSETERLFSLIFIYSESVDRAHMLFWGLPHPALYSHLHPFTPGTCPVFYRLATERLTGAIWGLSAVHRGTLATVIKAVSSLLFSTPGQIFRVMLISPQLVCTDVKLWYTPLC